MTTERTVRGAIHEQGFPVLDVVLRNPVTGAERACRAIMAFPADAILGIELLHECRLAIDWLSGTCDLTIRFLSVSKIP